METGTSLRISSQPRSAEKRLRKRKELDALVSNMMYVKVRSSNNSNSSNGGEGSNQVRGATRQLLGARHSDTSDTERFAAMEDDDEDDDENPSSKMTCTTSAGMAGLSTGSGGNRKFKAPYTLIRNGSSRKSQLGSPGLSFFCQCLCYLATAMVCVMTVASIFWLHIQLKMQAQDFNLQLKRVMDEKEILSDQHHTFQAQIEGLSSNQTSIKSNLSLIFKSVESLTSSVESLNGSLQIVLKSLEAAPLLKSLPSTVLQVQTEVAELGSRLTDLESQLTSSQKEVHVTLDNIKDSLANIKKLKIQEPESISESKFLPRQEFQHLQERLLNQTSHNEARFEALDSKFKEFATQITDQLQRQETRATKSWELLSQLEDNVQNVSAKAASSEVLCNANQEKLNLIQIKLDSTTRDVQSQIQTKIDSSLKDIRSEIQLSKNLRPEVKIEEKKLPTKLEGEDKMSVTQITKSD